MIRIGYRWTQGGYLFWVKLQDKGLVKKHVARKAHLCYDVRPSFSDLTPAQKKAMAYVLLGSKRRDFKFIRTDYQ